MSRQLSLDENVTQTNFFSHEEEIINEEENEMIFGEIDPEKWHAEVSRNSHKFGVPKNPLEMSCVDIYLQKL